LDPASPASLYRIVAAYTVNQLGWWFAFVALQLGVYNHTHSSLATAAVVAVAVLPALFATAVVARIEASPRRGSLTILYGIEGLCAVALALLLWQFSLPGILLVVAIDGSVAFAARALVRSEAARAGEAAEGVGAQSEDRPRAAAGTHRANAALNISLSVLSVGGPLLAGVAVTEIGAPTALLLDAVCFVIGGALLVDVRPHVEEAAASVRARVAAARSYLREATRVRALITTEGVALVFFFCVIPVEVVYASSALHAGGLGYVALLATWGTGQVVGSLLFARAGSRWLWAMLAGGTLAVGLAYIGYAAARSLEVACVAAVLGGLGNGVQWAAFIGVVQDLTPARLLGRIMGVTESVNAVAPLIGYSLGGALALASPRIAMLVAGVAASVLTLSFVRIGGLRPRAAESAEVGMLAGAESAPPEPGTTGVGP
jgi:MFS family permease